jgi:hypothetical protein
MPTISGKKSAAQKTVRQFVGKRSSEQSIVRIAERLGRLIPANELRTVPKDLSEQLDHYVYGSPKR